MRKFCLISATLLATAVARGGVGSTPDEWAARFAPEAGDGPKLPGYADSVDRANANVDAGRYRAAIGDTFRPTPKDAARAGLARAKALAGLGEVEAAVALLTRGPLADDRDALVFHAELLLDAEKAGDAMAIVDRLIADAPDAPRPRRLRGHALELAGRFADAVAAYHWFLDPQQDQLHKWQSDPDSFEDPAALTDLATAVHRWATLTSAYKDAPDLNDTVLAMYTRAFDVIDRTYTPARLAAAEFCLSRGDDGKADALLKPLEKSSPNGGGLLRLIGRHAAEDGNVGAMHETTDRLRDADPDSPDADLLQIFANAHGRLPGTGERAAALHRRFPDRLDVSGANAALAYLGGDEAKLFALLKEADDRFPTRSDAYVVAGRLLEAAFQRDAAVAVLKTAVDRTPWDAAPRHMLGDLYLNDGRDAEARAALDAAAALDPYHVKTLNYQRLLDELAKYDQRVSEHFVVYSDKEADPISAQQIGDYMEAAYADVCGVFDYRPRTKIVVQIYPNDDEFSVRMAGVPGIENYGVSFGRVLATIAPRKGTNQGNFNWARVLRHEFVHTINLLQTNNRCPRWLTEGLAVWQEKVPFRFDGVAAELYKRTFAGELFTIRGFPLAFTRPRRPGDGEQAYTQGAYLAMYLDATFGRASIVKLLDGYGHAKTDEAAFLAATGRPMSEVEKGWHAWMKTKLASWNYDEKSVAKAKVLASEGDAFIKAKNLPEALKTWQAANDLQPAEVRPHQRLAGLYLQKSLSDPAKAIEHLKFLHVLELQDNRYAKQIARLYQKLGDDTNAERWLHEATYVDLYDPAAHDALAEAAEKRGDAAAADAERQAAAQVRLWQEKRAAAAK